MTPIQHLWDLVTASEDLIAAIDGVTDMFAEEVARLRCAKTKAEEALKAIRKGGAQ